MDTRITSLTEPTIESCRARAADARRRAKLALDKRGVIFWTAMARAWEQTERVMAANKEVGEFLAAA